MRPFDELQALFRVNSQQASHSGEPSVKLAVIAERQIDFGVDGGIGRDADLVLGRGLADGAEERQADQPRRKKLLRIGAGA